MTASNTGLWHAHGFAQAILAQIDPSRASCSQSQQPGMDYRQFKYHDGLLFFKKLLYVPNGSCRLRVVQNCHDTDTTGHFGSTKTLDLYNDHSGGPVCNNLSKILFGLVIHAAEQKRQGIIHMV